MPWNSDPATTVDGRLIGDDPMDGLAGRTSQINGMCLAAHGKQMDLAMARMALAILDAEDDEEDDKKDQEKKDQEKKDEAKKEGSDSDKDKKEVAEQDKKKDEKPAAETAKKEEEKKEGEKKSEKPRKICWMGCPKASSDPCWPNWWRTKSDIR